MSAREYLNRVYYLLKVYLSVGLIAAFTGFVVMLIGIKPWIGAIFFIALETLVVLFFLLRRTACVLEIGRVRIEFRKPLQH
jgi:hypothetical protein